MRGSEGKQWLAGFLYYTLGLYPWETRMVRTNTALSGNVPGDWVNTQWVYSQGVIQKPLELKGAIGYVR